MFAVFNHTLYSDRTSQPSVPHTTVHNCSMQHSTEQFLSSRKTIITSQIFPYIKGKICQTRWYSFRVHIDYAISIVDLLTLRVALRSDDIVHERTSHACTARWYRPNTQCRTAIIISGIIIWKAWIYGHSATGYCCAFQHHIVWSVLCPLNILPVQADDDGSSCGGASSLGGQHCNAVPTPAVRSVNRGVWIVKVWSTAVHGVWRKIHIRRP